tara:strand:- start:922 stop:1098 length:177 start_codon:yes stop_codon:yes gene_type:complete
MHDSIITTKDYGPSVIDCEETIYSDKETIEVHDDSIIMVNDHGEIQETTGGFKRYTGD